MMSFGLNVTLIKNDCKCFVRYKNLTGFQHRQFSAFHSSWNVSVKSNGNQLCYKNGLKFNIKLSF